MQENIKGLYAAFKAKDARFDGRFFVGISSTGIYCRPVCKARQPKAENCTFFRTAAAAEQAGYRPCLLCRPELAPGTSVTDATADLVYRAARMLERNCGSGMNSDFIQRLPTRKRLPHQSAATPPRSATPERLGRSLMTVLFLNTISRPEEM